MVVLRCTLTFWGLYQKGNVVFFLEWVSSGNGDNGWFLELDPQKPVYLRFFTFPLRMPATVQTTMGRCRRVNSDNVTHHPKDLYKMSGNKRRAWLVCLMKVLFATEPSGWWPKGLGKTLLLCLDLVKSKQLNWTKWLGPEGSQQSLPSQTLLGFS